MAYYDAINELKSALDGYSAEEEKLKNYYDFAIKNAEDAYIKSLKELDSTYRADRNEAYADTARDDRNAQIMLAERGLGFSGEGAQARLNSNVLLANRLSDITKDKNRRIIDLELEKNEKRAGIDADMLDRLGEIKTQKLDILKEISDSSLELELSDKKILAEKELLAQKYANERKLLEAELKAKYGEASNGSNGSNSSNGSNGNSGSGNLTNDDLLNGWTPEMKPKDLAKLLISNSTYDNYVKTDEEAFKINKYLLDMKETYKVDDEYMDELIFMLKAYGFRELDDSEIKTQVISRDAEAYYWDKYDEFYLLMTANGMSESEAKSAAKEQASSSCLEYIYKESSKNVDIFRASAKAIGYSDEEIDGFIKRKQTFAFKGVGSTGISPEHTTVNLLK
ncbi:MAG: hypothetical protein IKT34_00885 [Clostridia bacterium]|nr:hypothetical protein [Clostridia bacterium]